MASRNRWPHLASKLFVVVCAALFASALAAAPAHAAFGTPQPLRIQLSSQDSSYNTTLVGELVGTVQFDSGGSAYRLRATVCRQGSYAFPNFNVYVNDTIRQDPGFGGPGRPEDCSSAYPYYNGSATFDGDFQFNGTIYNLKFCLRGVHYTLPDVKFPERCQTVDNPFN